MKLTYNQAASGPKKFSKKREPIPPGTYRLFVFDIEPRTPKTGGADYLSVTFEVEAGQYAGRKLWDLFFLDHTNEKARDVSRWRLEELAQSCDVPTLTDTDELVGGVCTAKVDIEEQEGFDPRNKVRRYLVLKAKSAAPTAPAAAPKVVERNALDDDIPF